MPLLQVAPNTVFFGDVKRGGETLTRLVLLRRTDGKAVPALAKWSGPHGVDVRTEDTLSSAMASTRKLRVSLDPGKASGDIKDGKIVLWLAGETRPLTVGVMVFLERKGDAATP